MQITSLGELKVEKKSFKHIEQKLEELTHSKWISLNEFQKQQQLSILLVKCIHEDEDKFLLRQVADFFEKVHQKKMCEQFTIYIFETFLNHYLKISAEENLKIRAKISGKNLPRSEYQSLFPIGMDKYYEGPHFVTAHASPDLDTMVSSFWGWVDAFSARVSLGCHFWNVPGGPPKGVVEKTMLFDQIFGSSFFELFSKDKTTLSLTAYDLFTKKGLKIVHPHFLLTELDDELQALVVTEKNGSYLSDWKGFDAENFRRITSAIFSIMRMFDASFQHQMIQAFSREQLSQADAKSIVRKALEKTFEDNEAFHDLPKKMKGQVHQFLSEVVGLKNGSKSTFEEFFIQMVGHGKIIKNVDLSAFNELYGNTIFSTHGQLIESRSKIMAVIDKAVILLNEIMELIRKVFASFKFALETKEKVFYQIDESVSSLSDLEEVKMRMGGHPFLTVSLHRDSNERFPLGVIYSHELQKKILGTVTCRDFTNRDETKIPSYLEVISGLDHHKMNLSSSSPMTLKIMDVQSANTLVALEAFKINDRYSLGGIDPNQIDSLMKEIDLKDASGIRVFQRYLQRKLNVKNESKGFIHPEREILEYYHFIFAILDDTDLLSKMTLIDLECLASLVNRLKSLQLGKEVEVVNFDHLDKNSPTFPKEAAAVLLQNPDLYSLYKTVYEKREKAVEIHLETILKTPVFPLFEDTKVQNGCARVGQKKLYSSNIKAFKKQKEGLCALWVDEAKSVVEKNPQIDLHLLMISTIASCEDVFKGSKAEYLHQDELWFYLPDNETAKMHFKLFLNQFKQNKMLVKHEKNLHFTIFGKNCAEYKSCIKESFLPCQIEEKNGPEGFIILSHDAGILNSRKTMISPFLPIL